MDVNGHTEVPRGLFGVHALKLTPELVEDWGIECFRQIHFGPGSGSAAWDKQGRLRAPFKDMPMVIDCQGDRYCPALVLTKPGYEEFFREIGQRYAQRCKDLNWHGYAEFWNEPYLNWAERSRKNYNPKFYDVSKATDGGPVTIKGWDKPLKYLRWRRLWARNEQGKIVHLAPVPEGAEPGDTFRHKLRLYFTPRGEQTYTVGEHWDVYDPTQVSFWSGKQNNDFYMWMFVPWAKAIKQTNPRVTVLGGWDFAITANGWEAWQLLYKPMIDEAIQWLDGVTEHHYGSNSRVNAATYEVVVGYAQAEHGKWLHCYNTETAGCVDPAVPGGRHGKATSYGAYNYGLRDIIELIYRCPDKAASRTAHASKSPGWGGGSDEFLFRLLKDLRGGLIHTASDDRHVWPVASLNGRKLVIVVFNDHRAERTVSLSVAAPSGTQLGEGMKVWVEPKAPRGPLRFRQAKVAAAGAQYKGDVQLPQKSAVKLVFPAKGRVPHKRELRRRQFFAKGVLNKVRRAQAATLHVKVDPGSLAEAEAAWLKVVLEGVRRGEGLVRVNGTAMKLPDHDWITEVPIAPKLLRPENTLVFEASGDGYQVDVASIVVDTPAE
jgi:hypothetical protein